MKLAGLLAVLVFAIENSHATIAPEPSGHVGPAGRTLTVLNGSGSGRYNAGQTVKIEGNGGPPGSVFMGWVMVSGRGTIGSWANQSDFTMASRSATVAAVYAKIECWFPPGSADKSKTGILLPADESGASPRMEQRIRVTFDAGEATAQLADDSLLRITAVRLDWSPGQQSLGIWGRDELIRFYDANEDGTEIPRDASIPNKLFKRVAPGVFEGSVWYESIWTLSEEGSERRKSAVRVAASSQSEEKSVPPTVAMSVILGTATSGSYLYKKAQANVDLLPVDIEGYKRGTINAPGAKVPKGSGEYGQEAVMMENADSEDNATQPDYSTTAVSASADDDLVKVILRWPKDLKINGVKLELKHTGMEVDPTKTSDADKYKETGPSRLNFYKPDGTKLTDADLKIDDLGTPGNGYLAEILTTGELTLFVEGAENFGNLGLTASKMKLLGGAMLNFEVTHNGTTSRSRLLVYRGGFLVFRQPNGQPGQTGTFEFWDGKGRVKNKSGGYQNEFQEDVTDWGTMLESWAAKSGKPNGSADYRTGGGKGYTPPGWWWAVENQLAATEQQLHKAAGYIQNRGQANEKWNQAAFNRWQQDDAPVGQRYTANYVYDKSIAHDAQIGQPTFVECKFRLFAIPPSTPYSRTGLLIHPDGKKDGTLGCIGLQTWDGCNGAANVLRRYHGLKLKVQHN